MKTIFKLSFIIFLVSACNACQDRISQEASFNTVGMVAYDCTSANGVSNIYVCNLQSGENINLTSTWKISSPCRPSFAPDGRRIVFQAKSSGKWHIYMYDVTTGELPVCLTADLGTDNEYPRFTQDGESIIFSRGGQLVKYDIGAKDTRVYTYDATSSYAWPSLSSDGNTLLYSSNVGGKSQIGQLNVSSLDSKQIFFESGRSNSQPVYVNGGILYTSKDSNGKYGIMMAANESAVPALKTSSGYDTADPAVCNGDYALVASNASGSWAIYAMGLRSGKIGDAIVALDECSLRNPSYSSSVVSIAAPADGGAGQIQGGDNITSDTEMPKLKGKLVYHNYTSYDAMDSRMYIYDFAAGTLTDISKAWTTVRHPMNGHFSADGRYICLMGIGTATDSWDIFLYDLEAGGQPVNLTPDGGYRDEDPKFSADGTKICFKRNDHLAEIEVATRSMKILYKDNQEPHSMPYYTPDGTKLLVGAGSGSNGYIGLWDIQGKNMTKLYDRPGLCEYYPIGIDSESFYFTTSGGAGGNYDQLYRGYYSRAEAKYLAFNKADADYSDAFPISEGWLFLVSTRRGGQGQYDLYIGNAESGAIFSLNKYNSNINTSKNELGPAYYVEK